MKHFNISEFDCKSSPGSGTNMDKQFLSMIDNAREKANTPFVINSGYRTKAYNEDLIKRGYQASPNSSHLKGKAADIHINPVTRDQIISACVQANFKRIGIAKTFIHVDNDNHKASPAVWVYSGVSEKLKELTLKLIRQTQP